MSAARDIFAYRTMRAVQGPPVEPTTRWERWQAFIYRIADRLLG